MPRLRWHARSIPAAAVAENRRMGQSQYIKRRCLWDLFFFSGSYIYLYIIFPHDSFFLASLPSSWLIPFNGSLGYLLFLSWRSDCLSAPTFSVFCDGHPTLAGHTRLTRVSGAIARGGCEQSPHVDQTSCLSFLCILSVCTLSVFLLSVSPDWIEVKRQPGPPIASVAKRRITVSVSFISGVSNCSLVFPGSLSV